MFLPNKTILRGCDMGKYPNSKIHDIYSDWRAKVYDKYPDLCKLYCSDIDSIEVGSSSTNRKWAEIDFNKGIVGILDLKRIDIGIKDNVTSTEKCLYDDLSLHYPVFIVYTTLTLDYFIVCQYPELENDIKFFTERQYCEWLASLRTLKTPLLLGQTAVLSALKQRKDISHED